MFSTAHGVAAYLNTHKTVNGQLTGRRPLRLLGPATSDSTFSDANHAPYNTFTTDLLAALKAEKFNLKSSIFGWSHHNYKDVANRMPLSPATTANPSSGNRAQLVRKLLTGTWGGYPSTSVNDPLIYLTEGGYHRPNGTPNSASQDTIQKSDLARAISRLKNSAGAGQPGDGIEMFTNFLFYTDMYLGVGYDSGLCRPAPADPSVSDELRPLRASRLRHMEDGLLIAQIDVAAIYWSEADRVCPPSVQVTTWPEIRNDEGSIPVPESSTWYPDASLAST